MNKSLPDHLEYGMRVSLVPGAHSFKGEPIDELLIARNTFYLASSFSTSAGAVFLRTTPVGTNDPETNVIDIDVNYILPYTHELELPVTTTKVEWAIRNSDGSGEWPVPDYVISRGANPERWAKRVAAAEGGKAVCRVVVTTITPWEIAR